VPATAGDSHLAKKRTAEEKTLKASVIWGECPEQARAGPTRKGPRGEQPGYQHEGRCRELQGTASQGGSYSPEERVGQGEGRSAETKEERGESGKRSAKAAA